MDTLTLVAVLCGAVAGGGVAWAAMTIGQLRRRVDLLEQAKQAPPPPDPAWADSLRLDHRQQLVSIAALVKLSARDNLDALVRLSPEMAREVVEAVAPHLFQKDGIK